MNVKILDLGKDQLSEAEIDVVAKLENDLDVGANERDYQLVSEFEEADLILIYESFKPRGYGQRKALLRNEAIRRHSGKILTFNGADHPIGWLDGAYVHLEASRFDPRRHISWPMIFPYNDNVYNYDFVDLFREEPSVFCSFRGSISHDIRKKMFELYGDGKSGIKLENVRKWYNHDKGEKERYCREILDSKFVLCPRGTCSQTHRIVESMALGRCPVVVADGWVPYDGVRIEEFAVRVPEKDVSFLADILNERIEDAEALGRRGRLIWEARYSRKNRLVSLLDALSELNNRRERVNVYARYKRHWNSRAFRKVVDASLWQRLLRWFRALRAAYVMKYVKKEKAFWEY